MSATRTAAFVPPDNRPALVEAGLRRFIAPKGEPKRFVLYTDHLRSTPGWKGLTDAEVVILKERGYVRVVEEGDRHRVSLTGSGLLARDLLARRPT